MHKLKKLRVFAMCASAASFGTLSACTAVAPRAASSSYGCMAAVVRDHVPPTLPDKRAHCLASGLIARHCSVGEAYMAGAGKEIRDLFGHGDAEWSDWQADRRGIACAYGPRRPGQPHRTCPMEALTFSATSLGSGAYVSWVASCCPSATIQFRKSARILPFRASLAGVGISSQVKLAMG